MIIQHQLTFSAALAALHYAGKRIAREGWNGKGMYLQYIDPAVDFQVSDQRLKERNIEGTLAPWIGMKTADNKFAPWLASQTDILAQDWTIVE